MRLDVLKSVLLLTAALTACSFESAPLHYFNPRGEVYVSPAFSAEEASVVLAALESWRDSTQGEVNLQARIGIGSPAIRPVAARERIVGEFTPGEHPEIRLDTSKTTDAQQLRNLTLHEVGHALGLQHIQRVDSIMFPMATRVQELDAWTLDAWARLEHAD